MAGDKRHAWGQAYRDGSLICDRVHVRLDRNRPAGAAPPQRRTVITRFEGCLHPTLRAELTELALCHGTAARRVAERIKPVVLLLGDPRHERERIFGQLLPPTTHRDDLRDVEYRFRELTP
jgi:hypothetical protein